MRVQRTLPPAASPLRNRDVLTGLRGWMQGNARLEAFRKEVATVSGVRFCFLASSGKAALYIILRALKRLQPHRTDVLIPAYTCFSVPSAIVRAKLKIKLCDVDLQSLGFDRADLNSSIPRHSLDSPPPTTASGAPWNGSSLLAVMPTRLFGLDSDTSFIREMLCDPKVAVIEDAAQSFPHCSDDRKN